LCLLHQIHECWAQLCRMCKDLLSSVRKSTVFLEIDMYRG